MKKFVKIFVALALVAAMVMSFTACGKNKAKVVAVDLSNEHYAFAIKKGNTELLSNVNAFFAAKADEISAIFAKYTAENVDLNDTSKFGADLQTTPTGADNELVVATNLEFAPFEYQIGSKIAGIDMEIAQLLATYLNKTLVICNMDFESVITSVETINTYDIGIAGLTITPDRANQVNFSDPYFGATQVLVVKENVTLFDECTTEEEVVNILKSLTGNDAKCGGQTGTTSQYYIQGNADFEFEGFSNLTFSGYTSAALAIQDMFNGNISFVVVDKTTANAIVSEINK